MPAEPGALFVDQVVTFGQEVTNERTLRQHQALGESLPRLVINLPASTTRLPVLAL